MTPAEQAYHDHLLIKPEMPRPFNPNVPEAFAWQRAMQWWVNKKDDLWCELVKERAGITFTIMSPTCGVYAPQPIDMHKNRKTKKPAWSGGTPEYYAQKARESRERKKARMEATRQAVREVIRERDAA